MDALRADADGLNGATLMITGGTGSFGSTMLRYFLSRPIGEVRVVSRDEKKQEDQRLRFADPRIKYHIADVRDARTIEMISQGVDFLYHAAALKQVPSCEFHPMEAVATNIVGTANVIDAAMRNSVRRVVCLSTDKAVYPVNAMGMSKALMEKVLVSRARFAQAGGCVVSATRYGNVLASRGSVVPLFVGQLQRGEPLTVTDPAMTRFIMTLDDAVDLCLHAFREGRGGDLFVQKAHSISIERLARAVLVTMGRPDHPIEVIGTRHGEKRHETLLSREEMAVAEDRGTYFRVPADQRDLNYGAFFGDSPSRLSDAEDFSSGSADQLSVAALVSILRGLPFIQNVLAGGIAHAA